MNRLRQRRALRWLAVHDEDPLQRAGHGLNPLQQFPLIGMATQLVDGLHLRAQAHRLAEDGDLRELVDELPPERVLCLEAGDENGVARILDVVAQMMQYPARFAHSRGRNHQEWPA